MHRFFRNVSLALLALCTVQVHAQPLKGAVADYPTKPIRWVVPFAAGASADGVTRLVAAKLRDLLRQELVIENRGGAGGRVGAEVVANATPDGYTLLLSNPGPSVNGPLLAKKALYRVDDFSPVIFFGYTPLLIVANPSFAPKNPHELVEYLKANPRKVSWGTGGIGSSAHIAVALFQDATGVDVIHVPYKGGAPAMIDLVGGQIQLVYASFASAEAQIKSGRAKIIANNVKRSPQAPDVPTLAESGLKDAEALVWFGMSAPAKTPREIIAKLNVEANKILLMPDVKRRLHELELQGGGGSPEDFDRFIRREANRLEKLIRAGVLTRE
ncbi:MAG: tripartite tricarboxylate transporter substrate binding protein [Betaproteobacteria bacterium]|nr:tripartite tricarboxylate transporter substrate binding protein [Betaproteobacteria bacterium]